MKEVVAVRSRYHTFVLDEVHKSHNVGAVLRTLDAFGFQDVYTVHDRTTFIRNKGITKGSDQWLTIHRFDSSTSCIEELKEKGYRVVVTTAGGRAIDEVDWGQKSAVVMGAELTGIDQAFVEKADLQVRVPMVGFVGSLNVSVATACVAFHLRRCLEHQRVPERFLSVQEQKKLLLQWGMFGNDVARS